MIDINKAREVFKNYVQKYNAENPKIALKIAHSYRVQELSKTIAENLKLDKEQIDLAELIGLLHDIGRFEQVKRYDTFEDRFSVNHAELGVEILKENNFLSEFCKDEKHHKTIYTAISNHNKFKIEEGLYEEDLIQAKIIRDADKIDIFNVLGKEKFETVYNQKEITNDYISDKVLEDFLQGKQTERKYFKTNMDNWISDIGMIFDLNFNISFKILKEKDYINKMMDRTKIKEMENIRKFVNDYIEDKIKNS